MPPAPHKKTVLALMRSLLLAIFLSATVLPAQFVFAKSQSLTRWQLPAPSRFECGQALHSVAPKVYAEKVMIGPKQVALIQWMTSDLESYLENFEDIFARRLERIERHQSERILDLEKRLSPLREKLNEATPEEKEILQIEMERLYQLHKPHAFVESYSSSDEFLEKFVGPKGKILKSTPPESERRAFDIPGTKKIYVDTWGVPFFNTGIQSLAEAKENVKRALTHFQNRDLTKGISLREFYSLMALHARPEFDDLRRYKLNPFPTLFDIARFGKERSDARTFGLRFPFENAIVMNQPVEVDPLSYLFGEKIHFLGLLSHNSPEILADGRIFTGPADFLEHDFAHAFFNLSPIIPGSPREWRKVHQKFRKLLASTKDKKVLTMMRLVYFHFTHESGFRTLLPNQNGVVDPLAFEKEIFLIEELLFTRNYYHWILGEPEFQDGYLPSLQKAFEIAGSFFKKEFQKIEFQHKKISGNKTQP